MSHGKSQAKLVDDLDRHVDDPILNQATVAAALGVSKTTVYRWLETGVLQSVRNPKGILKVRRSVLVNFLRSSRWNDEQTLERVETIEEGEE